ncbi:MAG TPA: restriction endonuclease [Gaiellaceae bacterium]|nr:restriction endonuclease [Gaiellaceae bacterium]
MFADSYRLPRLRRAVVGISRLELMVKRAALDLKRMSGWTVASLVWWFFAIILHSWTVAIVGAVLLTIVLLVWWAERRRYDVAEIEETDSLSGSEFEAWLEVFFTRLGFDCERTGRAGDFGADLIITWNGVRTAVQAKRTHFRVGVSAVQQATAARAYYECERAMVVTNQYFTTQAFLLAEKTGVVLRSRDDLTRKLYEQRVSHSQPR